ncbi:MAG: patatin-like phospholipase family protein [Gammaproteobacteria bacterium]|nr:MAG: patatin-like phospholipase family protein [Gammaproteobacteria bacterium]
MTKTAKGNIGLVLSGGGARSAYQVGVITAIAGMLPKGCANPFSVMTGTSAGSIVAAVLSSNALAFHRGVRRLEGFWRNMHTNLIYKTDTASALRSFASFTWAILRGNPGSGHALSILDNSPLRAVLEHHVRFTRIRQAITSGAMDAVGINVSGYTSARAVCFFEGQPELHGWGRARREGRRTDLNLNHLMASVAIPLIFPAVRIGPEYFGDGSMRSFSPLSPAIHLGADRLLIISLRDERPNPVHEDADPSPPSFGQMLGYVMDTLFMDSLQADLERLRRINQTLLFVPGGELRGESAILKRIETLVVKPSQDIREIANEHANEFPRTVRFLLRSLGAKGSGGGQLVSFLLFEPGYCNALIDLGYEDAMVKRDEILPFLGYD